MRRIALTMAFVLSVAGLTATMPAAAATVAQVCAATYAFPFDLGAAARVSVPNGAGRPRPAGMASAQALAREVSSQARQNPCDQAVSPSAQAGIDDVQELIDSGDPAGARALLADLLNGLQYSGPRTRAVPRASTTCDGFTSHDVTLPEDARTAIAIAQQA